MSTLTNNVQNIHVKLQFNDEFRRFFIPHNSLKYADLEQKIKTLLNFNKDIAIKYKDEENEWITISSDIELETGLIIAGNGIFRLLCQIKEENPLETVINDPILPNQTESCSEERGYWKKRGGSCKKGNDRKWKKKNQRFKEECNEPSTNNNEIALTDHEENDGVNPKKRRPRHSKIEKRERKRSQKGERKNGDREKEDSETSSTTGSESNSDVALFTLEEIKNELGKLKEEEKVLKEKVRGENVNLRELKNLIKDKRKDEKVKTDEILNLREELSGKKKVKNGFQAQLKNTRLRMDKLREAAETKV